MLTPEQEEAARIMYIRTQLSPEELEHWDRLKAADAAVDAAQEAYDALQKDCPHPLILREHKNEGSTGNWDRDDSYWTWHRCHMCDRRWSTNQRWAYLGGRQGHPDDEEAKRHDRD